MSGAVRLTMTVALVSMIGTTASAKPSLRTRIRTELCVFPEDFGGDLPIRRTEELKRLGEPARKALMSVARSRGASRDCALDYLWRLGDRRAISILRTIVADDSDSGRSTPVILLGLFNDQASLPMFLTFLKSEDPTLVRASISALSGVDDNRAREALRLIATNSTFNEHIIAAMDSLAKQRDREAVPLLLTVARAAEARGNSAVVFRAAVALTELDEVGLDAAVDVVSAISDTRMRSNAAKSIVSRLEGRITDRNVDSAHMREVIDLLRAWF
jgi:hypothetical protein